MPEYEKVVVVTRKTRLEQLVERFNTVGNARFYLESAGANFADYQAEHEAYQRAIEQVMRGCQAVVPRVHPIERSFLPAYLFSPRDMVVAVGQDGLVVNTAKYVDGQPIVAINPDPARFDGVLLPYHPAQAQAAVSRVVAGRERLRAITMAEVVLSDGQRLLAFNDLFIGPRTHTSARYTIRLGDRHETQSSSGLIVATGAGSSGWLSSMYNMATGMLPALGVGEAPSATSRFDWEADALRFVVREPFRSKTSGATLVYGDLGPGDTLRLESLMPEEGVIFSDGVEADFIKFNAGTTAAVAIAGRKTRLAVPD